MFVKEEQRQLVLTTHSEQFLVSLLTGVSEGLIEPSDLRCYLASKERKRTQFQEQKVQQSGQVEGGLASFVESEIEDLKKFLSIK
jgi:predicted ATPase